MNHPNLSGELNRKIEEATILGGAWIEKLPKGKALRVKTLNSTYIIRKDGDGYLWISGHYRYCPDPIQCNIHGSTFGGSVIRVGFIGRGMHLEVGLPSGRVMITSPIQEVEEIP